MGSGSGAASTWTVLALRGGIYAVAATPIAAAVVELAWLYAKRRRLIAQALAAPSDRLRWRAEVWPFQWRIGGSWLLGYMLVLMPTPLLFRAQGPVVAGQMGLTMTVANTLSLLAMSWLAARVPAMARAASTRQWSDLDGIYWRAFGKSATAFVAGAVAFMLARIGLEWTAYGARFLSVAETAALLAATGFYHASGMFAAYLRAHSREPFLWLSLIGAAMTGLAAVYAAPRWGAGGVVAILVAINALFFLPVSVWLWIHLRRKWHRPSA